MVFCHVVFSHIVCPRIRFVPRLDQRQYRLRDSGKFQIKPSALEDDSKHWIPPFLARAEKETRGICAKVHPRIDSCQWTLCRTIAYAL